jgi:NAD-dependent deacetylase
MDEWLTIAAQLRRAERILFITGAGLSADSGLPTYRGVGGLYAEGLTAEKLPIEAALSGPMLRRRPELTWKHLMQMEKACRGARANPGHRAIAAIEAHKPGTWVLTQNVDGLHGQAGSRNLIEIHGRLRDLVCTECAWSRSVPDFAGLELPPRCPDCRGLVRPDVVLFGELLPTRAVDQLERQRLLGFDMVFSVGTTSLFSYIAEPLLEAVARGVPTVEINPGRTEVSDAVRHRIADRAARSLQRLWQEAWA